MKKDIQVKIPPSLHHHRSNRLMKKLRIGPYRRLILSCNGYLKISPEDFNENWDEYVDIMIELVESNNIYISLFSLDIDDSNCVVFYLENDKYNTADDLIYLINHLPEKIKSLFEYIEYSVQDSYYDVTIKEYRLEIE